MISLARHGRTAYNLEGRFQGTLDVPLDEVGLAEAQVLAGNAAAHGFAELWCSPLLRARQTADVVGAALGLEPRPDPRFAEHDTGDWTNLLKGDIEAAEPDLWAAYMAAGEDWTFPGGENLEAFMERVVDGLVAVTQEKRFPVLVVCHRGVIRAARSHTNIRGLVTFHDWPVPNGALIEL